MPILSPNLRASINKAFETAHGYGHNLVTLEHVLYVLLREEAVANMLKHLHIDERALQGEYESYLQAMAASPDKARLDIFDLKLTEGVHSTVQRAVMQGQHLDMSEVTSLVFLLSCYSEKESHAVYFLRKGGLERSQVWLYMNEHGEVEGDREGDDEREREDKEAQYLVNLNDAARRGKIEPLVGRETELARMMQSLCRKYKNNPLLLGEPGVGKTALAEGLALKITEKSVPKTLENAVVYSLELGGLVAGTRYRGDFEKRIRTVLKRLREHNRSQEKVVLFIDEIHTLIGMGAAGEGAMDAANLLKTELAKGDIRFMGATTHAEFRKTLSRDSALVRRFQTIDIQAPNETATVHILEGVRHGLEDYHTVRYERAALKRAASLAKRYIRDRAAPDSAIDLLDEAGAKYQLQDTNDGRVSAKDIEAIVAEQMNMPNLSMARDDKAQLKRLDKAIKLQLYGQDNAVDEVVGAIQVARAGLGNPEKPLGSFLLMGPTGVGKTELCRLISGYLHIPLLRFDMSEYMEAHTVARLIGSPPGYIGHDKGGLLTEAVHKNPHALVLLDEIEKAHPDIFNLLLQVMDYGHMTDSNGREVNFRNTLVMMTSNVGAEAAGRASMGFVAQAHHDEVEREVVRVFRPEFRNRLDAMVRFNPLGKQEILRVVDKSLLALEMRLTDKGIGLKVTKKAKQWLADHGYDAKMGARPIERTVYQHLSRPIAAAMVAGNLRKGGLVQVDIGMNVGTNAQAGSDGTSSKATLVCTFQSKPDDAPASKANKSIGALV